MTLEKIKSKLGVDIVSKKENVITVRRGFFYTHGRSTKTLEDKVREKLPGSLILESGEAWKPFKGGASVANQSHWFVKFVLNKKGVSNETSL